MKKYYETSKAKKEIKDWDKKLRKSGFRDIETGYDKDTGYVHKQEFKVELANVVYFNRCSAYLHSGEIKDKTDLVIFENHCKGLSEREIVKELKKHKVLQLKLFAVNYRINRILKAARIKPLLGLSSKKLSETPLSEQEEKKVILKRKSSGEK